MPADHHYALPAGVTVGNYRLARVLGSGGFGITYDAHHLHTGARVALKEYLPFGYCARVPGYTMVEPAHGEHGDMFRWGRVRFIKEAETLARLDHPSIVRVTGHFEANDTAYMALAYEAGGTLGDWLKRLGRQPTQAELDRFAGPLTRALTQVHSLFLTHRDIKPDNIMLRPDLTPVLIDFGAAKVALAGQSRVAGRAGTYIVVSEGYSPPEQYARQEGLQGPWSDVYALAATLYRAVMGTPPPPSSDRQIEDTYRPLVTMPVGDGWRREFLVAIDSALSLKREQRPQSALEFRRVLGVASPAQQSGKPQRPGQDSAVDSNGASSVDADSDRQVPSSNDSSGAPGNSAVKSRSTQPRDVERDKAAPAAPIPVAEVRFNDSVPERSPVPATPASSQSVERPYVINPAPQPANEPGDGRSGRSISLRAIVIGAIPVVLTLFLVLLAWEVPPPAPQPAKEERIPRPKDTFRECDGCPEMVEVLAGTFTMGSPESEPGRTSAEGPLRNVSVATSFAAGRFAVTFAEWDACVAAGGCNNYRPGDRGWGRERRPVINVSWNDAKAYVAWLSNRSGKSYRLLSEAEREFMTRAGTTTPFWWGSSISTDQANFNGNFSYNNGPKGEYRARTVPVDWFQPNPWGIYQVHGNVWEWVEDCWSDSYKGAPTNGSVWIAGDCGRRVLRGGSWHFNPQVLRSAFRGGFASGYRNDDVGFRIARTLGP